MVSTECGLRAEIQYVGRRYVRLPARTYYSFPRDTIIWAEARAERENNTSDITLWDYGLNPLARPLSSFGKRKPERTVDQLGGSRESHAIVT
jgi:hypothetical protein